MRTQAWARNSAVIAVSELTAGLMIPADTELTAGQRRFVEFEALNRLGPSP